MHKVCDCEGREDEYDPVCKPMDACHKKGEFRKQAGVDVFILHQLKNKHEGINFFDEDQTEDGSGI